MKGNEFVKIFYLKFLCQKGLYQQALYFAFRMNLEYDSYPLILAEFVRQNPNALEKTKCEILVYDFFNFIKNPLILFLKEIIF